MSYVEKLPDELKKRYGGSGEYGYTEPQVRKTIDDLKLNKKHIQYAILIFCGESVLRDQGVDSESILDITNFLRKISSGGGVGDVANGGWSSICDAISGADRGGGDCGGE